MNKITYTVEVEDGYSAWYLNGKRHREDGPAIEGLSGYSAWFINGNLHREDGPAVEYSNGDSGYNAWYINGELHREDGPAIEYSNGTKKWFINGVKYTESEFKIKIQTSKDITVAELEKLLGYKIKIIK